MARKTDTRQWGARPWHAAGIRAIAIALPIALSIAFIHLASRVISVPTGSPWQFLGWWAALSAGATLVLVLVQRVTKRLLPLAALYRLSVVFPDEAPSRFTASLAAGSVASLERRIERAKQGGKEATPVEPSRPSGWAIQFARPHYGRRLLLPPPGR